MGPRILTGRQLVGRLPSDRLLLGNQISTDLVFATKLPSPKLTVTKPSPSSHTADHRGINIVDGIPVLAQLEGLWVHVFDSKAEADKVEQNFSQHLVRAQT